MNTNIRSDRRWWLLALLVVGVSLAGWFVFRHWYRDSFHDNSDPQVMARLLWIVAACTCVGIGIAMIAGARHDYVPMSGSLWSSSAAGLGRATAQLAQVDRMIATARGEVIDEGEPV